MLRQGIMSIQAIEQVRKPIQIPANISMAAQVSLTYSTLINIYIYVD